MESKLKELRKARGWTQAELAHREIVELVPDLGDVQNTHIIPITRQKSERNQ